MHIIIQARILSLLFTDFVTMKGSNFMGRYIFAFPSVTIAIKARNLLRNEDFNTDIIRTPRTLSVGCGYSVVVNGNVDAAAAVLEKNGIQPKAVGQL